ncbi:MAG: glutathione S-transferase [Gammaproteobacteria bacterium]|nr:glutathione S-transferase [Gammaproteobacteria bacterium]
MKLHTAARAPNPRRVEMFIAEKGITGIERIEVDLLKGEHRREEFQRLNPAVQVPVLELDDGTMLAETRAISGYLESLHPEPNLLGRTPRERAEIEMWDRRVELGLGFAIRDWVRHSHPALAVLEGRQFPDYAQVQAARARAHARWLDQELAGRPFIAGTRFTIADITAFCALEFARLVKLSPAAEGLQALQRWRDAIAARPSAVT